MVIRQGDVFWLDFGRRRGSAPAFRRPSVVVQSDRFNRSDIATTVVAAVTSNLNLARMPGNVRLDAGEAGLTRPSVINVSQLRTVDKIVLTDRAGALATARLAEVRRGLDLVFECGAPDAATEGE